MPIKLKLPKIIVVLGPTASGKTELALRLARKFNGEIVNADSRSVYKGMCIGTASPFRKKQKEKRKTNLVGGIKHHLFHFIEPWKTYSVGQYKQDALRVINGMIAHGKVPILVGGTGLYIWAVVDNLEIPKTPPQQELRKNLELRIKNEGRESLWAELIKLDPEAAEFVQKDNPRRIIRALEVALTTGKKFSELRRAGQPLYDVLQIGIRMPRAKLYKKIDLRADRQIRAGLIEETKKNYSRILKSLGKGRSKHSNILENVRMLVWAQPAMTALGYRQIGMYLRGELPLKEAIKILKRDTRRYAAKQISWFGRDKRIQWLSLIHKIERIIQKFLK